MIAETQSSSGTDTSRTTGRLSGPARTCRSIERSRQPNCNDSLRPASSADPIPSGLFSDAVGVVSAFDPVSRAVTPDPADDPEQVIHTRVWIARSADDQYELSQP